jgi:hypothetical protein
MDGLAVEKRDPAPTRRFPTGAVDELPPACQIEQR